MAVTDRAKWRPKYKTEMNSLRVPETKRLCTWRNNSLLRLPLLTSKVVTEVPTTGLATAATFRVCLDTSIDWMGGGLDGWKDGSNQF
jgi:hypothetical protein